MSCRPAGYAPRAQWTLGARLPQDLTVQELSPAGLSALGPTAVTLALLEGLDAHAQAVTRRLGAPRRTALMSWVSQIARPDIVARRPTSCRLGTRAHPPARE